MWIKNKSVKPKIDSLVLIAVIQDDDVIDYDVAVFGETADGKEVFDSFACGLLNFDEIEAYMPFEEYDPQKIKDL